MLTFPFTFRCKESAMIFSKLLMNQFISMLRKLLGVALLTNAIFSAALCLNQSFLLSIFYPVAEFSAATLGYNPFWDLSMASASTPCPLCGLLTNDKKTFFSLCGFQVASECSVLLTSLAHFPGLHIRNTFVWATPIPSPSLSDNKEHTIKMDCAFKVVSRYWMNSLHKAKCIPQTMCWLD